MCYFRSVLGRYIENIAYFEQIGGRMYFVDKRISSGPTDQALEVVLPEAPTFPIFDSFVESSVGASFLDLFTF